MSDTNVEVEDPAVVEVDLGDDETALAGGAEPAKKQDGDGQAVATPVSAKITPATTTAADEAATSLAQQIRQANLDRDAALATASAERAGREAAERQARVRAAEADEARAEAANSELRGITSGIEAAERDLAGAETAWKNAHESGDADAMVKAQSRIGKATAALDRLTVDKERFEAQAARRKDGGATDAESSTASNSREAWILSFAPKPQAWLRSHPDCMPPQFGGNPDRHRAMVSAHETALKGHPEGSEGYYQTVEEMLGYRPPTSAAAVTTAASGGAADAVTAARTEPVPAATKPRPTPVPSAPPSSATPSAGGGPARSQTVKLNAPQQEIARLSFPQKKDEADDQWLKRAYGTYARNLIEATKDGIIGRRTH
jgi:hypothetical protein